MWIDVCTIHNRTGRRIFNRLGVLEGKSTETCKFKWKNTGPIKTSRKPDISVMQSPSSYELAKSFSDSLKTASVPPSGPAAWERGL